MNNQCSHINRVSVHSSIKHGGASVGRCKRECLPLLVVCELHAVSEAICMAMKELAKENERLRQQLKR